MTYRTPVGPFQVPKRTLLKTFSVGEDLLSDNRLRRFQSRTTGHDGDLRRETALPAIKLQGVDAGLGEHVLEPALVPLGGGRVREVHVAGALNSPVPPRRHRAPQVVLHQVSLAGRLAVSPLAIAVDERVHP